MHCLQMEEALLKAEEDGGCSVECVTELRSLRHLDKVVDSAASSIIVVAFYSRVRASFEDHLRSLSKWHKSSACKKV